MGPPGLGKSLALSLSLLFLRSCPSCGDFPGPTVGSWLPGRVVLLTFLVLVFAHPLLAIYFYFVFTEFWIVSITALLPGLHAYGSCEVVAHVMFPF